jgi:hypothetical protein
MSSWIIFTAPNGEPLLVDMAAVAAVRPPLPSEEHEDESEVGAVVFLATHKWMIRENFDQVVSVMVRLGVPIRWANGEDVQAKG